MHWLCLPSPTGCRLSLWRGFVFFVIFLLLYGTVSPNNWKAATEIVVEEIQSCSRDCQCCSKDIWWHFRVKSCQRSKCVCGVGEMQNHSKWGCFSRVRGLEDQGTKDMKHLQFKMVKYKKRIFNQLGTEAKELAVINKLVIT